MRFEPKGANTIHSRIQTAPGLPHQSCMLNTLPSAARRLPPVCGAPNVHTKLLADSIKSLCAYKNTAPVILCIGTDRVTGDALGPLTGHILTNDLNAPVYVYGSLSRPVTALNLIEAVCFIKLKHRKSPIIAVDSSVGLKSDLGSIRVSGDGLFPGAASGKNLPKVGDVAVTATVADTPGELSSVPLGFVYGLAKTIAEAIHKSLCG